MAVVAVAPCQCFSLSCSSAMFAVKRLGSKRGRLKHSSLTPRPVAYSAGLLARFSETGAKLLREETTEWSQATSR